MRNEKVGCVDMGQKRKKATNLARLRFLLFIYCFFSFCLFVDAHRTSSFVGYCGEFESRIAQLECTSIVQINSMFDIAFIATAIARVHDQFAC